METLEMKLLLVTEEVAGLKKLEKGSNYFTIKDVSYYAVGCARPRRDFYQATIEIKPVEGSLCENAVRLFVRLKEVVYDEYLIQEKDTPKKEKNPYKKINPFFGLNL